MTDESPALITPEMRAHIGRESSPWTCEIDRTWVRMLARAIGHTDPVYYDPEHARAAGYRDLPVPPGHLWMPVYNPIGDPLLEPLPPPQYVPLPEGYRWSPMFDPAAEAMVQSQPQPAQPLPRTLDGGRDIEYFADICAGDVLTARMYVADYSERVASLGPMLITTLKTTFADEDGKLVAVVTNTSIRY